MTASLLFLLTLLDALNKMTMCTYIHSSYIPYSNESLVTLVSSSIIPRYLLALAYMRGVFPFWVCSMQSYKVCKRITAMKVVIVVVAVVEGGSSVGSNGSSLNLAVVEGGSSGSSSFFKFTEKYDRNQETVVAVVVVV